MNFYKVKFINGGGKIGFLTITLFTCDNSIQMTDSTRHFGCCRSFPRGGTAATVVACFCVPENGGAR